VKLSLRAKAVLLLLGVALIPTAVMVERQISAQEGTVKATEALAQIAVLNEIELRAMVPLNQMLDDAEAIADVFARAGQGGVSDEAAMEAARVLIGTRGRVAAARLEVPAAKVSTILHWKDLNEVVPESTPELRAQADAEGVAISLAGPTRGLVVARISGKGAAGYVAVRADLEAVERGVALAMEARFGRAGHVLLTTKDKRVVAAHGVPDAVPGESVASLPVWTLLEKVPERTAFSMTGSFTDAGTPMVGSLHTLVRTELGSLQNVARNGWVMTLWRPESEAYQILAEMRRNGLLVAAIVALLAAIAGLLAARGLTAPILAIVGQARLIAQRRWREVSFKVDRSDEIGELERGLGEMARDLEKGEVEAKLRGDLSRFMSKQLVDAIVKGEHPLALGGKRAAVSVIFADVVGFTPLAETRDAEQIVALLNELFSVLTEIVFRHGGTVDKFIGDAIMAVWGAPVAQEDHAARALGAAEDMMRFLETANEGWSEKYDVQIRLGIGVNSGEALVGNIGSDKRMEYTVIGDVVNVAARLEAIAQPNQVLVAEATRDLVGEAFALRKLGARKLTGRKTETGVYELEVD
jgi:class 3 adenylate cyclase